MLSAITKTDIEFQDKEPKINEFYTIKESVLKPFGHYKKCPKCGKENLKDSYKKHEAYMLPFTLGHRNKIITPEHMQIDCLDCSYSWETKVLHQTDCQYCGSSLEAKDGNCIKCGGPA